jgi:hypothetical protein
MIYKCKKVKSSLFKPASTVLITRPLFSSTLSLVGKRSTFWACRFFRSRKWMGDGSTICSFLWNNKHNLSRLLEHTKIRICIILVNLHPMMNSIERGRKRTLCSKPSNQEDNHGPHVVSLKNYDERIDYFPRGLLRRNLQNKLSALD